MIHATIKKHVCFSLCNEMHTVHQKLLWKQNVLQRIAICFVIVIYTESSHFKIIIEKVRWRRDIMNNLIRSQEFPRRSENGKSQTYPETGKGIRGAWGIQTLYQNTLRFLWRWGWRGRWWRKVASDSQCGFKSAVEAINRIKREISICRSRWTVAFLRDIRNVFNIVSWKIIIRVLGDLGISP